MIKDIITKEATIVPFGDGVKVSMPSFDALELIFNFSPLEIISAVGFDKCLEAMELDDIKSFLNKSK